MESFTASRAETPGTWQLTNWSFKCFVYKTNNKYYEILNNYIKILKNIQKHSSSVFNYFHFGYDNNDNLQFLFSLAFSRTQSN